MKKVLLIASVLLAVLAVSCKKEKPADSVDLSTPTSVTVPTEGDVVSITFTSNVPWTVKSSESWLTVSPSSGDAGTATVKASALKNTSTDSRTAEVTITAGTKTAKVTVTQGQLDALVVNTDEYSIEAEGGALEIPVSANLSYTVQIPEAVDWITVTKGMVDSKLVLNVAPTQVYDQDEYGAPTFDEDAIVRSAKVKIIAGGLSKEVTVNQKGFLPEFSYEGEWAGLQWSFYEGTPVVFPNEGGTFVIPVNTNMDWRAYMSYYDANIDAGVETMDNGWCAIAFDTTENTITLTMQANDSYFTREDYLYTVAIIDEVEDGNFGGLGWFVQAGKDVESASFNLAWSKTFTELGITAGYNRLAYSATGALLISDGENVHSISPADGSYNTQISYPGITPSSICSDDAGNIIVVPDVVADIDWGTYALTSGTELTIYYSADPTVMENSIVVENKDYGTVGGVRVRGNLAENAVITGVVGGSACWFGYDIENYAAVPNYYGTQNQGPGPGTFWSPIYAAAVSVGTSLHDGVLLRAYDGNESLYYLADAYTPNWVTPYEWQLITNAGSGGNENQNNLAIADYLGKRVVAYTQGFHFNYSSNALIYVLDATDLTDVKPLATINPTDDIEIPAEFTGASSADVLLHPTEECLEIYCINSGRGIVGKYCLNFD